MSAASKRTNKEFLSDLRTELIAMQEARLKLTLRKLLFITGLLGAGGALTSVIPEKTNPILLAPIIAIIFDLYIEGENFGIRRIGVFLKKIGSVPKSEKKWEKLLNKTKQKKFLGIFTIYQHRDLFASIASPVSTVLVCIIAFLFLYNMCGKFTGFVIYYLIVVILLLLLWLIVRNLIMHKRLNNFKESVKKQ